MKIPVAAELGVTRENAPRAIGPLVDAGFLTEFTCFTRKRM